MVKVFGIANEDGNPIDDGYSDEVAARRRAIVLAHRRNESVELCHHEVGAVWPDGHRIEPDEQWVAVLEAIDNAIDGGAGDDWDHPAAKEAVRLTEEIGMQWEFSDWADAARIAELRLADDYPAQCPERLVRCISS